MRVGCVCVRVCVVACVMRMCACWLRGCVCVWGCVRACVCGGGCVRMCNNGRENKDGVLIGLGNSELHEKTPKSVLLELRVQGTQGTIDWGEGGDLRYTRYN